MVGVRDAVEHADHQLLILDSKSHKCWEKADGVLVCEWTRHIIGEYVAGASFTSATYRNMKKWLKEDWSIQGFTALLCHNDEAAVGAMQALTEKGIRVPEDVSVISFDGAEYYDLVTPQLSSVQLPLREIGAGGVELLLKQIKADDVFFEHRVLPT